MPLLVGWRAKLLLDGNHCASLGCSSPSLRRWAPNGVASLVEGLLNAAGYDTGWRRGHGDVTAGSRRHDHTISPFRGSAKTSRRSPHGLTTHAFFRLLHRAVQNPVCRAATHRFAVLRICWTRSVCLCSRVASHRAADTVTGKGVSD